MLGKLLYTLWVRGRLYFAWSRLYRWLYHRKYRTEPIETLTSLSDIMERVNKLKWASDSFRELGDAIGDPHYVQWVYQQAQLNGIQPDGALDCDEFAVWAASLAAPFIFDSAVLNVVWTVDHRLEGHHVALLRLKGTRRLYHCGNWGLRGQFLTLQEVVTDILKSRFGSLNGEAPVDRLVGWTLFAPDTLQVYRSGTDLPDARMILRY